MVALLHEPDRMDIDDTNSSSGVPAPNKKLLDDETLEFVAMDHTNCKLLAIEPLDELDEELPVRLSMISK